MKEQKYLATLFSEKQLIAAKPLYVASLIEAEKDAEAMAERMDMPASGVWKKFRDDKGVVHKRQWTDKGKMELRLRQVGRD